MLKSLQEILQGDAEHALHHLWSDRLTIAEGAAIQNRVQSDPKYRDEYQGLLAVVASMQGLKEDRAIEEILRDYRPIASEAPGEKAPRTGYVCRNATWRSAHTWPFSHRGAGRTTAICKRTSPASANSRRSNSTMAAWSRSIPPASCWWTTASMPRRVVLERGEAYFEVAADPERPLTVDLGEPGPLPRWARRSTSARAPEQYQVAVIEGAIALHASAEDVSPVPPPISADEPTVVLDPRAEHRVEEGWVAEFDVNRNRLTAFQPESIDRYQEWRNGVLSFYPAPLLRGSPGAESLHAQEDPDRRRHAHGAGGLHGPGHPPRSTPLWKAWSSFCRSGLRAITTGS